MPSTPNLINNIANARVQTLLHRAQNISSTGTPASGIATLVGNPDNLTAHLTGIQINVIGIATIVPTKFLVQLLTAHTSGKTANGNAHQTAAKTNITST